MLQPKKVKWRKQQKGRMRGKAYRGCHLDFGDYGLQAVDRARVASRQIDAAREARRQGLDPHLSGQAGDEEAGRDPDGQGQG